MSKHTPGPLIANGRSIEENKRHARVLGIAYDASFNTPDVTLKEAEANARLWAAAPELLAALEGLFEDDVSGVLSDKRSSVKNALAAIAKARGLPEEAP